jgi:hypothetical protein
MDALHNLQSSGIICPGHVARIKDVRNEYNTVRKMKGKRPLMRARRSWEATVNMNPRKIRYEVMIISGPRHSSSG